MIFIEHLKEMKKTLLLIAVTFMLGITGQAQNVRINNNLRDIQTTLTDWDPIRGDWLASSFIAMSNNEPALDRTFPEVLTASQLFAFVPEDRRIRVLELLRENDSIERIGTDIVIDLGFDVLRMLAMISSPSTVRTSQTFGEPHIVSFSNEYSQNFKLGEFVLAKSNTSTFEVQARFEAIDRNASFATAVSMNVSGDIVSLYPNEKPDEVGYSALRINGEVITIDKYYYLSKGGVISYSNGKYTINWPSGESAIVEFKKYKNKQYLDIALRVHSVDNNEHTGLVVNQLSDSRINSESSLFSYEKGRDANYYRDIKQINTSRRNMSKKERSKAEVVCMDAGIEGAAMEGYLYDYVHFNITPSPSPLFDQPADYITLPKLYEPIINNNSTNRGVTANGVLLAEEPNKKTRKKMNVDTGEIMRVAGRILIGIALSGSGTPIRR
mgnify:CR=1 FL=1